MPPAAGSSEPLQSFRIHWLSVPERRRQQKRYPGKRTGVFSSCRRQRSEMRKAMKKVTIQDIADALGVSRNTVSKAINNSDGLAEATREKILQKAVEMGYKQFSYFQAFSANTNRISGSAGFQGEIALLTSKFLNQSHFASLMLDKFQREISQLGYTLNTHRVSSDELARGVLPPTFSTERTSGILCIEMFDFKYDEMLCSLGLPILFVDGPVKSWGRSLPADQLYMENTDCVISFVVEMLSRGYKRIGFIGNPRHCHSFFERYSAFRTAMLMEGYPVRNEDIVMANDREQMEQQLAGMKSLPDLYVCANDFVALDAIRALEALGKSVPGDVMLCGFDDSAESRTSRPPLTTCHIHTQTMAFSAVQLLLTRMQEPSLDYRIVHTQTDLIYRASTEK